MVKARADIAIGGLSGSDPYRYQLTVSDVYHQSPLIFVVRGGLKFGPLTQLTNPLSINVWIPLGTVLLIAVIIIKLIEANCTPFVRNRILGPRNQNPIANTFASLLGYSIPDAQHEVFPRYILLLWLLFTFVLRNAYQGALFDSLRMCRKVPVPKSISELLEKNYILIASSESDQYPRNKTLIVEVNYISRFHIVNDALKYTSLALLENLDYFNKHHWPYSEIVAVDEPVLLLPLVMYFRKHSFFKFPFDRKLKQLIAAGIVGSIVDSNTKGDVKNLESQDAGALKKITNNLLTGTFEMYGFLTVLSITSFLLEMLSCQVRFLRKIFNWIHGTSF